MKSKSDDRKAALERENAELRRQLDESLAQQAATAKVLEVINSSRGDLAPVFEAMLERAATLCDADEGVLRTFDGDLFHAVAVHGDHSGGLDSLLKLGPIRNARDSTLFGSLVRGEGVVHISDVRETDTYRDKPEARARLDLRAVRTFLGVALRKEDILVGALLMHRRIVRPFTDRQIALLQNFAAQAVIAMENARLLTETREALEQQTATAEVLQVINSSPGDPTPVFDTILEKALRLCGGAYGTLHRYDGELFHVMAAVHRDGRIVDAVRNRPPFRPTPGGPLHRIVQGELVASVEDLLQDHVYRGEDQGSAQFRPIVDSAGYRSMLSLALRNDGVLLGDIGIFRTELGKFSEKQIALLQNFAAQAVIAIENARLITETREALDRQTAVSEVLAVMSSATGELQPVFDTVLANAVRICGGAFGLFGLWENDGFRGVSTAGVGAVFADTLSRIRHPPPGTSLNLAQLTKQTVHQPDCAADPAYDPIRAVNPDFAKVRTNLTVPMLREGEFVGALAIYRHDVRPFDVKQVELVENFAKQAVIAIENTRLLTETREALEQQTATAEVLQVINSSPGDLAPVFDAILGKAMLLCEAAFGVMFTYDGEYFHLAGHRGFPRGSELLEMGRDRPQPGPDTGFGRIVRGERLVHIVDITDTDAYRNGEPTRRATADVLGARTSIFVALVKDDVLLGGMHAYRREVRPFTDKQIALLQNFAAQAVIAMENARLLGELRSSTQEVAELNRGLEARVAEQVEELDRVGRLKRFLAPQLAELIVSQGDEKILESHRREIVVVFCDLRGYTAFTETAEPEEVLDFLREYHGALGPLVAEFEGTLDQFSGDGIMVFFNDPVPIPDPAERAVRMAMAMREAAGGLTAAWRRRGRDLGFGVGIAQGYATLGQIGFAERSGYTAIGTVCNVAARLCAEAKDGQILLSQRVAAGLDGGVALEEIGPLALKGLTQPVIAFNAAETASPASRLKLV